MRSTVSKLCQFHLKFTLTCRCSLSKNIKYHNSPVNNLHIKHIRQIVKLCRCKLIITYHRVSMMLYNKLPHFLNLSLSYISSRMNLLPVLNNLCHGLNTGRLTQFDKFIKRFLCIIVIRSCNPNHDNPFLLLRCIK